MQDVQQAAKTRLTPQDPAPSRIRRSRRVDRLITDWDTTPGKLRVARIVLVLGVLLAGGVGVQAAITRTDAIREITQSIAPLNDDVTTLYRSLADADATLASGFLSGVVEPGEVRSRYDHDVAVAAASLAKAGAQGGQDVVTANRIADIDAQLPVYSGLVERARANNRQGLPVGVAYLRHASELMQTSILPAAEELQRYQAARLDLAYQRAGSVPVIALGSGVVSLAGLIWAQVFLFQRTHRIFNIGLVAATTAVLAGSLWWTVAVGISAGYQRDSRAHSESVSDALGPAQIVALKARAIESVGLIGRSGVVSEPDFQAKIQLLARHQGAGGALGAARKFATDQQGKALVEQAARDVVRYQAAHKKVRDLDDAGEYEQAITAAIGAGPDSAAATFQQLDDKLAEAVRHERAEFDADIGRAARRLTGLAIGTGLCAFAAAVGVAFGVRQRLEEYR